MLFIFSSLNTIPCTSTPSVTVNRKVHESAPMSPITTEDRDTSDVDLVSKLDYSSPHITRIRKVDSQSRRHSNIFEIFQDNDSLDMFSQKHQLSNIESNDMSDSSFQRPTVSKTVPTPVNVNVNITSDGRHKTPVNVNVKVSTASSSSSNDQSRKYTKLKLRKKSKVCCTNPSEINEVSPELLQRNKPNITVSPSDLCSPENVSVFESQDIICSGGSSGYVSMKPSQSQSSNTSINRSDMSMDNVQSKPTHSKLGKKKGKKYEDHTCCPANFEPVECIKKKNPRQKRVSSWVKNPYSKKAFVWYSSDSDFE